MTDSHAPIGGFLEFELPRPGGQLHASAHTFQSAAAAWRSLLEGLDDGAVWLPMYMCGSMVNAAVSAGREVRRYRLAPDLAPAQDFEPEPGDLVLCVNYFGISEAQVRSAVMRFGPERSIVDNAQALFSAPQPCLGTLYSPRKFVGVPDGGLLMTSQALDLPATEDSGSVARCTALLQRLAFGPEYALAEFQRKERELAGMAPMRMSVLTRRLLGTIDYQVVADRRKANFQFLHQHLASINELEIGDTDFVPLAYPLLLRGVPLREKLRARGIYAAHYWPEVEAEAAAGFESELARWLCPLPCDQRYGPADMERLVNEVMKLSR